jgi:hypothetical protein
MSPVKPDEEMLKVIERLKELNPDLSAHAIGKAMFRAGSKMLQASPERLGEFLGKRIVG